MSFQMTEVGVLDSFTFLHSAINLNPQHEQFLKRIQMPIDELKVIYFLKRYNLCIFYNINLDYMFIL